MYFGKHYLIVVCRDNLMKNTNEIIQLESWLVILINTYIEHPSINLAKIISYYIDRILTHDDFELNQPNNCQYIAMRKYWHWLSLQH